MQITKDPIGKDIFMPKILPELLAGGLIKANELSVLKEGASPTDARN